MVYFMVKMKKELDSEIPKAEVIDVETTGEKEGYFSFKIRGEGKNGKIYELRSQNKKDRDKWVEILKRWLNGEYDNTISTPILMSKNNKQIISSTNNLGNNKKKS